MIYTTESAVIKTQPSNVTMTICVHGTFYPPKISINNIFAIMRDKIDNTLYSRAVDYMRQDPRFFQGQAIQELGLKKIDMSPYAKHSTARTVASLYNLQLERLGKGHEKNLYYTFGWHGLLSDSKRYEESEKLYTDLIAEISKLRSENINPKVRIIAYSHGGNVVLYLPKVRDDRNPSPEDELVIDELITLATPIQMLTDHFIADRLFKKAYHFFSEEDVIQIADFASSGQILPQRYFTNRRNFKVPEKLTQVRLRCTKKIRFRHTAPDGILPHELLEQSTIKLVHKDPHHTEMWSFGWAACWYRPTFPLKPLPIMSLIPTIIHTLEQAPKEHTFLTFDYAPGEDGVLLKHEKKNSYKKAFPFMTATLQKELWELADKYRPKNFSIKIQEGLVALALGKARKDLVAVKRYKKPHNKTLAIYMHRIDAGYFDTIPGVNKNRSTLMARARF